MSYENRTLEITQLEERKERRKPMQSMGHHKKKLRVIEILEEGEGEGNRKLIYGNNG